MSKKIKSFLFWFASAIFISYPVISLTEANLLYVWLVAFAIPFAFFCGWAFANETALSDTRIKAINEAVNIASKPVSGMTFQKFYTNGLVMRDPQGRDLFVSTDDLLDELNKRANAINDLK